MALHQRTVEADHANASRREAENMRRMISTAQASGVLGDGRLAHLYDAQAAGLLNPNGLFLGALDGRPLFYSGDAPLLTYAKTGTGKGRDYVLPNLAHCRDRSLIVIDVKDAENAYASWQHRSDTLDQPCIFLNPYELLGLPDTKINPLNLLIEIVKRGDDIDTQAEEIAQILLPPPSKDKGDGWVRKGALRLLSMRMEYLARFDPENCTLGGLWRFVNASKSDWDMAFAMMATCGMEGIERRALSLQATAKDAPKQFEAYKSDAIEALNPFEPGKTLERTTAAHEFDFAKLKHQAFTVFLMTPSDKLGVVAPWISLIVNYAIEAIAREAGPIRTTFILDEFPQLPPAPAITKALRLYRGRGIQLWFFSQGRYSLEERWSPSAVKEFEDQAAIFTMTCVEDPSLMADIERWSGNKTVLMRGINRSGGTVESAGANLGENKRPVLQSEDIRKVGDGRQIIRAAGVPYLVGCDRVPFYDVTPWKDQMRDVRDLHKGAAT